VARRVIAAEALAGPLVLGLHLLDDAALREANRRLRGVDAATDVLSFPLLSRLQTSESGFALPPGEPRHLGDVLISVERARVQAAEYGHSLDRELCYLLAHGVLHLLGYDHVRPSERRAMRQREEAALRPFGLTR
jgi:probable rRNA maturation factor